MNTPAHADAAIRGLQESRIRSVFAYGFGNTSLVGLVVRAGLCGQRPDIDGADARRIRKQYFNSDDGRITMALATRGPNFCKPDVVRHDWELAKELGLNITVHVAMDRFGYTKMQVTTLCATWTCSTRTPPTSTPRTSRDEEWALVRDSGGNVSFAPQIEVQMGHGWAPAVTALELRHADRAVVGRRDDRPVRPVHPDALDLRLGARPQAPGSVGREPRRPRGVARAHHRPARSSSWATLGGAKVAGIADRTGSLTPGKQADIVIIDGSAVNVAPIIDPVGAVVCAADVSNVKTVIVDGEILKEDFRLKASTRRAAQGRRGVARLPRLEVRRSGARLGGQGHRVASRVTP